MYKTVSTIRDWPYGLLDEIFQYDSMAMFVLPDDFPGSFTYALCLLPEKMQAILLARYKHKKTLDEIGAEFCVTRENVRQTIDSGIRKLRHPSIIRFIRYGVRGVLNMETEKAAEKGRMRAEAYAASRFLTEHMNDPEGARSHAQTVVQDIPIDALVLSSRSTNCLIRWGLKTVGDIMALDKIEFQRIWGFGAKSRQEVVDMLRDLGLNADHLVYDHVKFFAVNGKEE